MHERLNVALDTGRHIRRGLVGAAASYLPSFDRGSAKLQYTFRL